MFKHTSLSATSQVATLGERISLAIRRRLIVAAVGGSLAATLVAPAAAVAAAPQVRLARPSAAHTLLIADGPNTWCGGAPIPC